MSAGDSHNHDHDIRLRGRSELEITGVQKVSSFDVHAFELVTTAGHLHIEGDALHMKHFDVQAGIVRIEGRIIGLQYDDDAKKKTFVGRLLR
ncbi:YabP/YqfC family sporulation protein [Alicyclobacillus dauci]|uniref:Sporulation protein YabP n=1 Tax=Alicyclobacillus dauci TaxID=1475485 RepID=A0ABY6Z492_9BACL|nr:YabP/YqfC family sporulation protein [Alicyclobacillus dauci]WAH37338.1 hypothetical protein NZD86_01980 [Alicyclobacillus dauci]